MDRPAAGGFLSLTGLWPEGCGGGFAAIFKRGGAASAAGCVEGLQKKVVKKVLKMDRPYGPEGS